MKKVLLGLAVAAIALSCKKIPAGGNHGRLKLEDDVERYSDDHQEGGASHGDAHAHGAASHESAKKSAVKVELNGTQLNAFAGGLEEQMVAFLKGGSYTNAADDAALKDKWYNFDQVNFKMGSANQLEAGSAQQLDNLANILKAFPDAKVKIGGYTDKTGDEAKNVELSLKRADFIKAELGKKGVGAQVLSAEGYGSKFATVAADKSDAERAIDRKMAVRFAK